jgi:phosphopantothenoylcysteine synthetase/decarboxylase
LSFEGPVLFAPAMNARMWAHPAVSENVEKLRSRGAHFIGPAAGRLACGETGPGRMSEPEEILAAIEALLPGKGGRGKRRRRT